MKIKLLILLILFALTASGSVVDSLKIKLKNTNGINRINILNSLAFQLWEVDARQAYDYAFEARELSTKSSYKTGLAWALNNMALSFISQNKNEEAYSLLQKAKKIFIEIKADSGLAECYDNIGDTQRFRGRIDSALYYYRLSLPVYQRMGDKKGEAMAYSGIGLMYWRKGLNNEALNYFYAAYYIRKEMGLKYETAMSLNNLGTIYWRYANYEKALEYYSEALQIRDVIADWRGQIITMGNIGLIFLKMKNFTKAEAFFRDGLAQSEKMNYLFGMAYSNHNLGLLYLDKKAADSSILYSTKAVKYYYDMSELNAVAHSLSYIGSAYAVKGDNKRAVKFFQAAIDTALKANDNYSLAITYQSFAKLHLEKGEIDAAEIYLQKAYQIAKKENLTDLVIEHYSIYSDLLRKKGNISGSFDYYKKYIETRDELRLEQINNDVTNWQIKYETELKETENKKLRQENVFKQAQIDNQRSLNNLLMILLLVALFAIVVSVLYFRLKRKTEQKIIEQKNELERLNRELESKNDNLEEANRSKDKLFSIISHDLRSPFQAIIGLSDILISEKDSITEEETASFIKGINESGKNLLTLTNNILEWSKVQLDKISVDKKKFTLGEIFEQLVSTYSAQYSEKQMKVEICCGAEISIFSDKQLLSTILRNFLNNSIKFSNPGGTIKIGAEQNNDSVHLFVEDEGVGISDTDLPKLFDIKSNYSTGGTNDEKGTGLGLIICKEFSELLNGTIAIKSKLNEGTRITVSLPIELPQESTK